MAIQSLVQTHNIHLTAAIAIAMAYVPPRLVLLRHRRSHAVMRMAIQLPVPALNIRLTAPMQMVNVHPKHAQPVFLQPSVHRLFHSPVPMQMAILRCAIRLNTHHIAHTILSAEFVDLKRALLQPFVLRSYHLHVTRPTMTKLPVPIRSFLHFARTIRPPTSAVPKRVQTLAHLRLLHLPAAMQMET